MSPPNKNPGASDGSGVLKKTPVGVTSVEEERRVTRGYFFFLPAVLAFFLAGFFLAMGTFYYEAARDARTILQARDFFSRARKPKICGAMRSRRGFDGRARGKICALSAR